MNTAKAAHLIGSTHHSVAVAAECREIVRSDADEAVSDAGGEASLMGILHPLIRRQVAQTTQATGRWRMTSHRGYNAATNDERKSIEELAVCQGDGSRLGTFR